MNSTTASGVPTSWQSLQAAMLYHYASTDQLRCLHTTVTGLIDGIVDPLLDLAKLQNRDAVGSSDRWGQRDISETWANCAWPFLSDLQRRLAKDIALRAFDQYTLTATDECLRGAEQNSMFWVTDEEERRYQAAVKLINRIAGPIDNTLSWREMGRWDDFGLMMSYPPYRAEQPLCPQFRIRTDISGRTGEAPPRTGVYISADDPHAALQFAWAGKFPCKLRLAATFNDIGIAALGYVGRPGLWTDTLKMFDFAAQPEYWPLFRDHIEINGIVHGDLAPSAVAISAFEHRPSNWYFVEQIGNVQVGTDLIWAGEPNISGPTLLAAGDRCKVSGFYYSTAHIDSQCYFNAGETMLSLGGEFDKTFWLSDARK